MNEIQSVDNNLRPYTRGITERDSAIASITLYTASPMTSSDQDNGVNYLDPSSLEKVDPLQPKINNQTDLDTLRNVTSVDPLVLNKEEEGGLYFGVFNNFSLLEVMESKDSITKLHQNFGQSWNLFFFGDSPSAYTFRGIFLDTWEYPYYQEFMTMYDKFLKGKKCVEYGFKMKISYDGKIVGGYLLNIKTIISADAPHTKTFSFTIIVTDENYMRQNAVVKAGKFTSESDFNRMNNSHRVPNNTGLSIE